MELVNVVKQAPICGHRFRVKTTPDLAKSWEVGLRGICPSCHFHGKRPKSFARKGQIRNRKLLREDLVSPQGWKSDGPANPFTKGIHVQ